MSNGAARGGVGEKEESYPRELGKKYLDSAAEEAGAQTVDYMKENMQPMLDDAQTQIGEAVENGKAEVQAAKEEAQAEIEAKRQQAQDELDARKQQAQDELNAEKARAQAAFDDAKNASVSSIFCASC
ncbi:hypothetical protein C8R43DRAFT_951246 [Mycena crocata]|nr:hypothetical protein C8R43DRAFT_951246 [Mycena crocata]